MCSSLYGYYVQYIIHISLSWALVGFFFPVRGNKNLIGLLIFRQYKFYTIISKCLVCTMLWYTLVMKARKMVWIGYRSNVKEQDVVVFAFGLKKSSYEITRRRTEINFTILRKQVDIYLIKYSLSYISLNIENIKTTIKTTTLNLYYEEKKSHRSTA